MDKKIINNAISAYLGLGTLLLLPSKKESLNNSFVKKHAKTGAFIHFLMLINYLIFITYGLFGGVVIFESYSLNHIIASIIFLGLFGWLLYGINKAKSGNDFSIGDMAKISKTDNVIQIKNSNLNEQGILTIILSLIPFIGFIIRGKFKNYKSPIIENNIKLNLIFCLIISFLYIIGDNNILLFFLLIYTIFIGFYSLLIISKQNILTINLNKTPTFENIYFFSVTFFKYILNYFKSKGFVSIKEMYDNEIKIQNEKKLIDKENMSKLKENKLPNFLSYIPFLNIISLVDFNSKNKTHIINGLLLTIICIILWYFDLNKYQILVLFPIFFGIGYLKFIEYKLPFIYNIYQLFEVIFLKIFILKNNITETKNTIQEVTFTQSDI